VLRILVKAPTTEAPPTETSIVEMDVIGESDLIALIDDAIAEAETKLGVDASTATRQSTVILNLRYVGTEPYLSIACGTDARFQIENVKRDFEAAHLREFGFVKKDASIELVAARAEASVICKPDAEATRAEETFAPTTDRHQKIYSGGKWSTASLFNRSALEPGAKVHGPAIIASRLSTTVIDPGWVAETLSDGTILIEPDAAKPAEKVAAANRSDVANGFGQPDPVTLEIFNQHFSAIASRMGISLQKTSVSVNVKERLDFSCALFTGSGDLVVNAPHIPVHLGAMSETVRQVISRNGKIKPGSVFVTNNPYAGGSHLPDVTVVSPVFVNNADAGPTFWVASRSHHSEIGGKTPGSMPPDANCLGEEGVLIDNFSLIAEDGSSRFEALRQILLAPPYPSRSPDENLADVAAQVAANRTGEQQLLGLVAEHGRDVVVANMHFIQQAAETKARTAIAKLPDGVTRFEDSLDNGAMIRVQITKANDRLEINFSGTDPVQRNNFNANRAIVSSAVMYVVRLLIDDEIPLNEGVMKPVEIVLPECFLNPEPAEDLSSSPPVVGGNVETSQRIVDVLIGSLNVAAASQGTMNNWLMGDDSFGYYETLGGGSGATSQAAGADAVHVHMTNTRLTDPEVLESRYPVVLRESSVRNGSGGGNDSGGAGKHRGGNGMVREIEFKSTLSISLLTNRRNCEPWGIEGGENGSSGINLLIAQDGSEPRRLPGVFQFQSQPGDRLRIETPGGGGWGKPRQG
jgi:5-oxoprolinase (ATP-hydrolysing)